MTALDGYHATVQLTENFDRNLKTRNIRLSFSVVSSGEMPHKFQFRKLEF